MIKLMVFDVDGTLYDLNHHEIPASCIQALGQAKKTGVLFAIATGRPHYGLGKALMQLEPDYIMAVNGAMLVDKQQTILFQHDFKVEDVEQINEFCHRNEAGLCWKFPDRYVIYQHPEKIDWLKGQMNSDIDSDVFTFCTQQDAHLTQLPLSASIHVSPKAAAQFANHPRLALLQYSETGYDVVLKNMDKGVGLRELKEKLNLRKEEVVAFGDNYNDLPMMIEAGIKIAMGNAVEELKQVATYVTTSTDQDGIAKGLQFLNLIK